MIKQILLSLGAVATVSCLIGYGVSNIFGFWHATTLAFVIQFIGFFIYNGHIVNKRKIETEYLINERLTVLSKNFVNFLCPCGNKVFEEVIYLNTENIFKCDKCDNDIEVGITISPIIKTQPLNIEETYSKLQKVNQDSML
ncbi:hypothetical protein EBU95_20285 [bacterium]|nr:hypothetical protein [bacterium]